MPAAVSLTSLRERLVAVKLPRLCSDSELASVLGDQVTPRRLLSFVEAEPGLIIEVLQRANARLHESAEPRGVQQALNLLGLSQVQGLLRSQRGQPRLTPGVPGHANCLRAMATSRLAWLYLSPWLRSSLASDEDQRLSMLIVLGVARWKLPLAEPAIASEIERRVEAGERRASVERRLLGATLDQLNLLHLQDLGFPNVEQYRPLLRIDPDSLAAAARHAWLQTQALDLPPALAQALRQKEWGCSLAYALALQTQADWYCGRTRQLVAAASAWLRRPLDEVLRGLQRQAVNASTEERFTRGLRAPAVGLLWPPRPPRAGVTDAAASTASPTRRLAPWMQPQPASPAPPTHALNEVHTAPAPVAATVHEPQAPAAPLGPAPERAALLQSGPSAARLPNYLQRCEHAAFKDLRELLARTLQLFAALQLQRSALFLRRAGSDPLSCYIAQGFAPATARGLSIAAGEHGLLPRLLAQQNSAFWVQPAQLPSIAGKLPTALAEWPNSTGFALAAVQTGGHAFGFWWADSGETGAALTPTRFAEFRRAVGGFGPEFARLMRAQQQAAAKSAQ